MRILIISDVHANKYPLEKIFETARAIDYVIFLGDAVDYGPHPVEVIDLLRDYVDVWVMGNHDNAVAFGVDCQCASALHELSVYVREKVTHTLIEKDQLELLRKLPLKRKINIRDNIFYCVHASPRDPLYEYVTPDLPNEELLKVLHEKTIDEEKLVEANYVLLGHSHKPFSRQVAGIKVINPGSVGQPRDGDPRASFAILDLQKKEISIKRLKYPVEKTIADIKKFKLEKKYEKMLIEILLTGHVP